jgi:hypothetical protein
VKQENGSPKAGVAMDVMGSTPHPFRVTASVPDEMVSLDPDGEWAAWSGVDCRSAHGRTSVVLVCLAVAPFDPAPGTSGAALEAALRARHPIGAGRVDEFTGVSGNPGVRVSSMVTQRVNRRRVTTGQVQALVVFPGARALGVVSAICPDPADLDRAARLALRIAARMTVTAATAAA